MTEASEKLTLKDANFIDGEWMADAHPATFNIPPEKVRYALAKGTHVKSGLRGEDDGASASG